MNQTAATNEPQLHVKRKRRFWSKRSHVQVQLRLKLPERFALGPLIDRFLSDPDLLADVGTALSIPHAASSVSQPQTIVKNIRGWRLSENEGATEELIRIAGSIRLPNEILPLSFRITTKFLEFGARSIDYSAAAKAHSPIRLRLRPLNVRDVCRAVPVTIEEVAIGIERFRSEPSGGLLGGNSDVFSLFHWKLTGSELAFDWSIELARDSEFAALPAEIHALSAALARAALYPNLLNAIREKL